MDFTIFLLPLLGGFLFSALWWRTRYYAYHWTGYRLFFAAACSGVVLMVAAFCVTRGLSMCTDWPEAQWEWLVPNERSFLGTCVLAMVLGPLAAVAMNALDEGISPLLSWSRKKLGSEKRVEKAVHNQGSHLDQLIWRSLHKERLLLVTMDSGKVYIGYAESDSQPHSPVEYLALLKIQSGYRKEDTGELRLTTEYMDLVEAFRENHEDFEPPDFAPLEAEDFVIAIPVSKIASASVFDTDVFASYRDGQLNLGELKKLKAERRGE